MCHGVKSLSEVDGHQGQRCLTFPTLRMIPSTIMRFSEQPEAHEKPFWRGDSGQAAANLNVMIRENSLSTTDPTVMGRQFAIESRAAGSVDFGINVVVFSLKAFGRTPETSHAVNSRASRLPARSHFTKSCLVTSSGPGAELFFMRWRLSLTSVAEIGDQKNWFETRSQASN